MLSIPFEFLLEPFYLKDLTLIIHRIHREFFLILSSTHVRHEKLGNAHGEAYANLAMRVLRALFNKFCRQTFACAQGEKVYQVSGQLATSIRKKRRNKMRLAVLSLQRMTSISN